ncbi:MAG TPA: glycosyltransferase family 4 protein [Candidatus Tyrphobacter sp.]
MTRPLVLHVAAFGNPAGGSFVSGLVRLAQRHATFETALLCPKSSARYPWTHLLRKSGVRVVYAKTAFEVVATVARMRPTVVHAHFVAWALPAMLGATAAHARLAWHLHSGVPLGASRRNLARHAKYAMAKRLVDRFYCVSPDLIEYLERYGISRSHIVELPNGVDLERFRPPTLRERAAARRAFGLAPRDRAIAFFGRDARIKGADRLARALPLVEPRPHTLVLAPSAESLAMLAYDRTIDVGCVADVREVFWACDAFALPSRIETVTYGLLEARGCGLPAVVSPLPGIERTFRTDVGTEIVDTDDARAFARALERALQRGITPLSRAMADSVSLDLWSDRLAGWYTLREAA